jgi:hypothetical protein
VILARFGFLASSVLLGSCAGAGAPRFATLAESPDEPRRPPGVALDPISELPAPAPSGTTRERLLVLRTPLDTALPREAVERFFDTVADEDEAALGTLLVPDAAIQIGAQGTRQSARSFWQTRFARFAYGSLSGVLRDGALETYNSEDAVKLASSRALPLAVKADDVLVRAPIARTHLGKTRLFGDEIVFLLTPSGKTYKISVMLEDFTPQ